MTGAELLLVILASCVAWFFARRSQPAVAFFVAASALGVSGMLFLPTSMLVGWFGADRVQHLHGLAGLTPLALPDWIHLGAFAWLGLLVWLSRADMRTRFGLLVIATFGIGGELSQWLAVGRQLKLEDAVLNVIGGWAGALAAQVSHLGVAACRRHAQREGQNKS